MLIVRPPCAGGGHPSSSTRIRHNQMDSRTSSINRHDPLSFCPKPTPCQAAATAASVCSGSCSSSNESHRNRTKKKRKKQDEALLVVVVGRDASDSGQTIVNGGDGLRLSSCNNVRPSPCSFATPSPVFSSFSPGSCFLRRPVMHRKVRRTKAASVSDVEDRKQPSREVPGRLRSRRVGPSLLAAFRFSDLKPCSPLSPSTLFIICVLLLLLLCRCEGSRAKRYVNQWAVQVPGGEEVARRVAHDHGFVFDGHIIADYYSFVATHVRRRSVRQAPRYQSSLQRSPEVRWVKQLEVLKRVKRDFLPADVPRHDRGAFRINQSQDASPNRQPLQCPSSSGDKFNQICNSQSAMSTLINDPEWPQMWYLNRGPGLDHNVKEAWDLGYTGKNIVVTILDDGLERTHRDIAPNYDQLASYDINDRDSDPMPRYDMTNENRHGTRCAGEVAAVQNNTLCIVGIAYGAKIGGIRMLDGEVTDSVEAASLSLNRQHIDIYSASWGPDDDGKTVDGPGRLASVAFRDGVNEGRGGKGSIFVWASGNGGRDSDSCNCDGYTNSIYTLSISSASENGRVPWYSEACSSTLATTYSSGEKDERMVVTTDLHNGCIRDHTGTSASAPLAAGICALTLEANPNLTWRDMQHIVVRTARPQNLFANDWVTNGVGRNVSHSFGYGLMDAGAMVRLARNWTTVPPQKNCSISYRLPANGEAVPRSSILKLVISVTYPCGDPPDQVVYLEHVKARITIMSEVRGNLRIFLTSPAGTTSTLLPLRDHDKMRSGFRDWAFMTTHNWGEKVAGKWTVEVENKYWSDATLMKLELIFYGTSSAVGPFGGAMVSDERSVSPVGAETSGATSPEDRLLEIGLRRRLLLCFFVFLVGSFALS